VKLLDWFKSAVAVVKMPAEQPKAEAQPHEPARNGGMPAEMPNYRPTPTVTLEFLG